MAGNWDPARVKAQLRLAAQRLGQLQSKMDSEGEITRRDVATLLGQANVPLARAKATKLLREEALGDVLETLEMQIGVVLERLGELEHSGPPGPALVEAASSIIFAAPQVDSRDLQAVRDILAQRLGIDFVRSAEGNRDNHVSKRVVRGLDQTPPPAAHLDHFMYTIARSNNVQWRPALTPQEKLHGLSELLDPESSNPLIDMMRLRKLCASGIPAHPPWLRPRIWRLLFGTLPVLRASWGVEARKQRDSYYDLVKRLLEPLASLPTPTSPLAPADRGIMNVYQQLTRVPHSLFVALEGEPEATPMAPLDEASPQGIQIACASNLDKRLLMLQAGSSSTATPSTPEITLDSPVPDISLTEPPASPTKSTLPSSKSPNTPTTLLHSKVLNASGAHQKHATALLRLLYIHSCLNPANRSPHVASLLVPLYSALIQEIEIEDLAHVEADTFWVFEAMISEFSDLEDEDGGTVWMQKFSQRLAWADEELFSNLLAKGLDPALPHYSYRWLAPLLSHTLPLPAIFPAWDAIFSRPPRARDSNPKEEHLVDICTSMLVRAKGPLFMLGKSGRRSPSLWTADYGMAPPPSPVRPWEAGDAFLEGMTLLQAYPIDAAGGIDGILQTAADFLQRRESEATAAKPSNQGFGARIRDTMWRGFTNTPASQPEEEQPRSPVAPRHLEDGNETETPAASSSRWTARLGETVWKGITNQSAMEPPPSPISPSTPNISPIPSPLPSPSPLPRAEGLHPSAASSPATSLWGYASKLRDSDTAATLSKVGSNWTAKAMDAWAKKPTSPLSAASAPEAKNTAPASSSVAGYFRRESVSSTSSRGTDRNSRQSSLAVDITNDTYSPPPRPAFFRPPRDSMMPMPRRDSRSSAPVSSPLPPVSPELSPTHTSHSEGGLADRAHHLQESLSQLMGYGTPAAPKPSPKVAPRPLLLGGGAGTVTGHSPSRSISRSVTPVGHQRQWSEVSRTRSPHRDSLASQSSVSSLAPNDAWRRDSVRSDWDSDGGAGGSKVVPLRRSVSPMAPNFRTNGSRPPSSAGSSGHRDSMLSMGTMEIVTSPTLSSPAPLTPPHYGSGAKVIANTALRTGFTLTDPGPAVEIASPTKFIQKRPTLPNLEIDDTSDASVSGVPMPRSPRIRSKRQARPPHLQLDEPKKDPVEQPSPADSLRPEWPVMQDDTDVAITPRAANFEGSDSSPSSPVSPGAQLASAATIKRAHKVSARSTEVRTRKVSGDRRVRKVSTEGRAARAAPRDSEAEQGDDEGFDDLLSSYESEDPGKM